jgi:hypothetical protein
MYVAMVRLEKGLYYNVMTSTGASARVLNEVPFERENVAFMWMLKHSRKLCSS